MQKHIPIPIQNCKLLQELQHVITAKLPDSYNLERIVNELSNEQFIEYGWLMLKQARLDPYVWKNVKIHIKNVRRNRTNPGHLLIRIRFKITAPAYTNNYITLQHTLGQALMDAGLPVVMGLEKTPRLAVKLGYHLPLCTEGHNELADATLLGPIKASLSDLPKLINFYTPQGVCILEVTQINNHASSVADLCHKAHWQWICKKELLNQIGNKIDFFVKSKQYNVEKIVKINGKSTIIQVDIRNLFENCIWDGQNLRFQTTITPGQASNPNKLLASILGNTTNPAGNLSRIKIELKNDLRLLQAHKFGIKLHNIYEDAIVLDNVIKYDLKKL